jgi:hypothetical protein
LDRVTCDLRLACLPELELRASDMHHCELHLHHTHSQVPLNMADGKMEGVVMGAGLVDPSKYPVPIET